jgi:hypothetical protein
MPYSPSDLEREVHAMIATQLEAGHTIIRGWIEHDILTRHPLPVISDYDFNVMCRRQQVNRAVLDVLRSLHDPKIVAGRGGTPILPGFEHLRLGYPFKREDGELIVIPLSKMTTAQILARADDYDQMAIGCREHAEELRRYASMAA